MNTERTTSMETGTGDLFGAGPSRLAADLAAMREILDADGGWMKSEALHGRHRRLSPRRIRELAEAAGGEVISCPAKGYRLTRHASPEEVRHAMADLRSRARKLLARLAATSRTWHAAGHGAPRGE